MTKAVSARRTRSPAVGPYISAYACREIFTATSEISHDFPLKAKNPPQAAIGHQAHGARLAGLESYCGAGRNIEPVAATELAVEPQARIGLKKVIVRSHLDGPIPGVFHAQGDGLSAGVQFNITGSWHECAWNHGCGLLYDWLVNGNQFSTVRKCGLDLDLRNHLWDSLHDLFPREN